jgi:hypothetical protein
MLDSFPRISAISHQLIKLKLAKSIEPATGKAED